MTQTGKPIRRPAPKPQPNPITRPPIPRTVRKPVLQRSVSEQFIDRVINTLLEMRLSISEVKDGKVSDYVGQGDIKRDPEEGTWEYLKQTGQIVKRSETPQGRRISRRLKGAARRAEQGQRPHQQPPREGS